jgi:hypothetical protein
MAAGKSRIRLAEVALGSPRAIEKLSIQKQTAAPEFLRRIAMHHRRLEPISKSLEEDDEASKLDKAEEIVGVVLPSNEDPALPLNPGEEALDEPASHVAA